MEGTPCALVAVTLEQRSSLAELPKRKKYCLYEGITTENASNYHKISCRPITRTAEDDMELISDIVTWGEQYLHHWSDGTYNCSRCDNAMYSSTDKYHGPCVWPSFRKPIRPDSIAADTITQYHAYTVTVKEVYCGKCFLFVGHQFEDAKAKGDSHPDAHWRH